MADIFTDSRYSRANIKTDENGTDYLDWFSDIKFEITDFDDNIQYTIKPEDTVFTLASRFLGKQKYFWVVCRANVIFNPFEKLVPGKKLLIPSRKTFESRIIGDL